MFSFPVMAITLVKIIFTTSSIFHLLAFHQLNYAEPQLCRQSNMNATQGQLCLGKIHARKTSDFFYIGCLLANGVNT